MHHFKSDSSIKRILKNGYFTAMRFGLVSFINVFFIAFLLDRFGKASFGLIALAGFLTQYIGFISGCIGSSVSRFLNVALNKNDWEEAREIFCTALFANLLLVAIQLPLFALAIWKLDWIIDFPPEKSTDFRILVICNTAVFLVGLIKGVIFTPIYAANRLDINAKFDMLRELLRFAVLFALIIWVGPYLWLIGAVELVVSVIIGIVGYRVYKRLVMDQLVFKRKYINRKWIKPVMNMAGWGAVASLGQILFQKTDVLIINKLIDPALAGVCAAIVIWPNFVLQIVKNLSNMLMPVFVIDYAHNRTERIQSAVLFLCKAYTILALVVVGGAILFGGWAMNLWVEDFGQYNTYLVLMLIHFPLTLTREAMWSIFPAFNRMEYLGISNLISGVLNIGLSLLAAFLGYGMAGVIIATGISLILQRTFFLTVFTAKLLDIKKTEFVIIYIPGTVLLVAYVLQWIVTGNTLVWPVGVLSLVMGIGYCVWVVMRDDTYRRLLKSVRASLKRGESPPAVDGPVEG